MAQTTRNASFGPVLVAAAFIEPKSVVGVGGGGPGGAGSTGVDVVAVVDVVG